MKTGSVWLVALLCATSAAAQDDEARIEQLLAPARPANARAAAKRPAAAPVPAAWIGQPVRVETIDRGLYLGRLLATAGDVVTLEIALPERVLHYSVPRAAIAKLELDGASP